jgi:hypothetical protein
LRTAQGIFLFCRFVFACLGFYSLAIWNSASETAMSKLSIVVIALAAGLVLSCFSAYYTHSLNLESIKENSQLSASLEVAQSKISQLETDNGLMNEKLSDLNGSYLALNQSYFSFEKSVFENSDPNSSAVTVVYYTDFGGDQQIMTVSISNSLYDFYHRKNHPAWDTLNLQSAETYITSNEPIITQIVEKVKNQTGSQEELADALLDFVQYKKHGLSLRYYVTPELKYPVETLVEMGGDCDTHSFLYATLLKAAGFKVVLLYSELVTVGVRHAAVAVHLDMPPEHSLPNYEDRFFVYEGEKYYFAETTISNYRVGDVPKEVANLSYAVVPV